MVGKSKFDEFEARYGSLISDVDDFFAQVVTPDKISQLEDYEVVDDNGYFSRIVSVDDGFFVTTGEDGNNRLDFTSIPLDQQMMILDKLFNNF